MKHTRMRGERGSRSSTPAGTTISHRKETQIAIQFKMQNTHIHNKKKTATLTQETEKKAIG